MDAIKKTPLYEEHLRLNARMVDFAGWSMPVQYVGLREEHLNVRSKVGLFDVSHMGEIRVQGPHALRTLQWLTSNDVSKLGAGQAQYSLLPNDQGGLVDDIIVYCLQANSDYLLCVNASNKDKDLAWILQQNQLPSCQAQVTDESALWAQIAVQGPQACALLNQVFSFAVNEMKSFCVQALTWQGHSVLLATTGYTGEKGAEVFIANAGAAALWRTLLETGKDLGAMAIGLGARDTLRTEMKYSLYGHEIDDHSNPYQAGLGWVIKPQSKDFVGKAAILAGNDKKRSLVGFKLLDKGIPRQGYALVDGQGEKIGLVTSGTVSPTLDESIGIAYVGNQFAKEGHEFFVDIRGRQVRARVCKTPFVQTSL